MADAIIVGAGPAGLTAATYLLRFRRSVLVVDAGQSRARWIPKSHNIPAFSKGIDGRSLLRELTSQALRYGAQIISGNVHSIAQASTGFAVSIGDRVLSSRFVILATGVVDRLPDIPGASEALGRGIMRVCPICDAYEAIDHKIAVIGSGEHAEREALFLLPYSRQITLLQMDSSHRQDIRSRLGSVGIAVIDADISNMRFGKEGLKLRFGMGQ